MKPETSERPAFKVVLYTDGNIVIEPGPARQVRVNNNMAGWVLDSSLRALKLSDEDRGKALAIICSRLPAVVATSLGIPFEEGY